MRPWRAATSSANALEAAGSAWLERTTSTPSSSACAAATLSGLDPVDTTVAPSALKSRAVAAPMPVVPPVIRATLPCNLAIVRFPYR